MSEALYMEDSYLKEFDAKVVSVSDGKFVVLDKTAFYPNSGGQPFDEGVMKQDDEEFKVVFVGKFSGEISHEVNRHGLKKGDKVHCVIDWDKRYKLMRAHTSAHIVSTLIHNEMGALISGNQLGVDKVRIDFSLDDYDAEKMVEYIKKANEIAKKGMDVKAYYLPRDEAMKIPSVVKLANALPPAIDTLRIVEIGDFDKQADGGTHVKNTSEIGELEFMKAENKGKNNRRVYYSLKN
ncbi:MAG: alanyl-tRNA editing protein AlaXM [Nanoarchaeota archaeon]|nr:alanyl-tRNA editing protein [Nanoarchaeota archaeon]MBU1030126.1 alanyl-tRNA editing protein [Nanoarchaeota archaeon]MBU1850634.1 alanyl-tRNA editing protein [Nanoarchaeota archaeon]